MDIRTDLAQVRQERPWLVREWSEKISLPGAVEGDVINHLVAIAPQVALLGEEEQRFYAYAEKRELSKYVHGETTEKLYQRAQSAIERGAGTIFGDALIASPLRHDAKLCAWLGNYAKQIGGRP